jgi:hypothetical protein
MVGAQRTEGSRKNALNESVLATSLKGMQMKEKICLTGLLLGSNHGCIATNPNQSVLQFNRNIPFHFQPTNLRLRRQLGMLCLPLFGILREFCESIFGSVVKI